MYARQILKKISEKVVVMINKDCRGGGILEFVGVTTVMSVKLSLKREVVSLSGYTTWKTQFSSFHQNLFQTATSANQLGLFLVS